MRSCSSPGVAGPYVPQSEYVIRSQRSSQTKESCVQGDRFMPVARTLPETRKGKMP